MDYANDNPTYSKALHFAELAYKDQIGEMPHDSAPKAYLAGPMSGIPQFNVPAFDKTAQHLRDNGIVVISPAELDSPEEREEMLASADGDHSALVHTRSWADCLRRDLMIVLGVDCVWAMLGWDESRGARLETSVAFQLGTPVYYYPTGQEIDPLYHPHDLLMLR